MVTEIIENELNIFTTLRLYVVLLEFFGVLEFLLPMEAFTFLKKWQIDSIVTRDIM